MEGGSELAAKALDAVKNVENASKLLNSEEWGLFNVAIDSEETCKKLEEELPGFSLRTQPEIEKLLEAMKKNYEVWTKVLFVIKKV